MSASTFVFADSATMLRRNLLHMRRYPSLSLFMAGIPVLFLLLFVYVFGGTLGDGIGGAFGSALGGREAYIAYVVPGVLLMGVAGAATNASILVAMDMTEGIVARFRTMSIARSAVLIGHVVGSMISTAIAIVIVLVVALVIGFRPTTGPLEWLGAAGILLLASFAVTWLGVALGLAAGSVETASNSPMFLTILPFLGSGFVPTATMPDLLRLFADNQPFTPINETLRGLLLGTPIGNSGVIAVAWCVAISLVSFLWARRLYERAPRAR